MEIFRGTSVAISRKIPTPDSTVSTVTWKSAKSEGTLPTTMSYDNTTAQATLPYQGFDGEVEVVWNFLIPNVGVVPEYDYFEVVTPVLTNAEILEVHPNATLQEIIRIERATRHIINAFTGQTFGREYSAKTVRGGGTTLLLPGRLLKLEKFNGYAVTTEVNIAADGWALTKPKYGVPPVKADAWGLHMHTGGVIHNPNNIRVGTFNNAEYTIEGEWGWKYVPESVKEAARLLVDDYACADIEYRDRYLTSMTAADWRIQFNSGAFTGTGNVRADQLLSDYILARGWAVI